MQDTMDILKTSLPKVTWEQGCATLQSPHWLQWHCPNLPPKLPLPVDQSPNPTTCLIPGPIRPISPNRIHIHSAVFPQCTRQTHRQTYTSTKRWLAGMVYNHRLLTLHTERHFPCIYYSLISAHLGKLEVGYKSCLIKTELWTNF